MGLMLKESPQDSSCLAEVTRHRCDPHHCISEEAYLSSGLPRNKSYAKWHQIRTTKESSAGKDPLTAEIQTMIDAAMSGSLKTRTRAARIPTDVKTRTDQIQH